MEKFIKKFALGAIALLLFSNTAFAVGLNTSVGVQSYTTLEGSVNVVPIDTTYEQGSTSTRWAKMWTVDLDVFGVFTFGGTMGSNLDMDGYNIIMDTDGDSSFVNDRGGVVNDDEIGIILNGGLDFLLDENIFHVLPGSEFSVEGGTFYMGTATYDTGDFIMQDGNQTGDDTMTASLSHDGAGDASFTTSDGHITLASNDDIIFKTVGGEVGILPVSTATAGNTIVDPGIFKMISSDWDTDDNVAKDTGWSIEVEGESDADPRAILTFDFWRDGVEYLSDVVRLDSGRMSLNASLRFITSPTIETFSDVPITIAGDPQDGSGLESLKVDTQVTLATAGDKLATFNNNSVEKAYIDYLGLGSFNGGLLSGSATVDGGAITIIKGAQTSDPQVILALSADDQGDFSITPDTGDIDLVPTDDVDITLPATGRLYLDGTTTRTGANELFNMTGTLDTTTATDDVNGEIMALTRAAADTGGTRGFETTITTGNMANGEWSYNYGGTYVTAAATTATSNSAVFYAGSSTVDAQVNDYGVYITSGYDTAGYFDGTVTITGAIGTGDIIMSSAQPTLNYDDTGAADHTNNATIYGNCTDTGSGAEDCDVVMSQYVAGALTEFINADADGNLTIGQAGQQVDTTGAFHLLTPSDATVGTTVVNSSEFSVEGSGWDTDGAASTIGVRQYMIPTSGATVRGAYHFKFFRDGANINTGFSMNTAGTMIATGSIYSATGLVGSSGTTTTSTLISYKADAADAVAAAVNAGTVLTTPGAKIFSIQNNEVEKAYFDYLGGETILQGISTTGVAVAGLTVTGGAHTGLTAATEAIGVNFNLAASKTWAAGAGPLAAQREVVIQAPTYVGDAGGALTMTKASTFVIDNAPTAGANMTITNPYALEVTAGNVLFGGDLNVTGAVGGITTLGLTGPITQAPTAPGTLYEMALETEWTTGLLVGAGFNSATTLSGEIGGVLLDFNKNLTATNQSAYGFGVELPAVTNTGGDTYEYIGYGAYGDEIIQTTAAGTNMFIGFDVELPDITQTTGVIDSYGLKVTGGIITGGKQYGLYVTNADSHLNGRLTGLTTTIEGTQNVALTLSVPDQQIADADGVGLTIRADDGGSGGAGNHNGGDITFDLGAKQGTGLDGSIELQVGGVSFAQIQGVGSALTVPAIIGLDADGADAGGVVVGSFNDFTTSGSKLLAVLNNTSAGPGSESIFHIESDGTGWDTVFYDATNDSNLEYRMGSTDADEVHMQTVFDAGAQTLNYFDISTDSAGEGDIALNPASTFVGINNTAPTVALDVMGAIKASTDITIAGNVVITPIADATFLAAATVPSTGAIQRVAGDGAARSLTSTPSIADAAADGVCIKFFGTSAANTLTFQDEDNLAATGLALNGDVDITIGLGDNFEVCYDSGDDLWRETYRALTIDD